MSSEELYELCCRGSEEGWKEAARYVYGIVSCKSWRLPDDEKQALMNETLLYFLEYGLENIENPAAFKGLLRMKAISNVIDNHRKTARYIPVADPPDHDDDDCGGGEYILPIKPNCERTLINRQALEICTSIIASLKQECREILPQYFRYKALGNGVGQLAKDLKKPLGSIASAVHRCLKKLYANPQIIQLRVEIYGQGQ